MKNILEFVGSAFPRKENKEAPALIHPDFKIKGDIYDDEVRRWYWNWLELKPSPIRKKYAAPIKLAFPFEDPTLLNNCPFMCKVGENIGTNPETKYYGVAYATEEDAQTLSDWGQRFPHAKLITNLEPFNFGTRAQSKIEYIKKKGEDEK